MLRVATSRGERRRQVLRQVATQQRLMLSVGMNDLFSLAGAKVPACSRAHGAAVGVQGLTTSPPCLSAAEGT